MRRHLPLVLLITLVAACDSGEQAGYDGPAALRYFAPEAAVVARAEAGGIARAGSLAGSAAALLDTLGLRADEVETAWATADPRAPAQQAEAMLVTRLDAGTLRSRLTATGRTGTAYRSALVYALPEGAVAVHGRVVLTARTDAAARALVDRYENGAPSLADEAEVVRLFGRLTGAPAGAVAREPAALLGAVLPDSTGALPFGLLPIAYATVRVGSDASGPATLWLTPPASTPATDLAGLLAAVRTLALASDGLDPALRTLLETLQITPDAPDVRLDLAALPPATVFFPAR